MSSYCVKCHKFTANVSPHMVKPKNNRNMVRSKCGTCHGSKSQFVSGSASKGRKKAGAGFFGDIASFFI